MSADSAIRAFFFFFSPFLRLLSFSSLSLLPRIREVRSQSSPLGFHWHFGRDLMGMKFLALSSALLHNTLMSGWFVRGEVQSGEGRCLGFLYWPLWPWVEVGALFPFLIWSVFAWSRLSYCLKFFCSARMPFWLDRECFNFFFFSEPAGIPGLPASSAVKSGVCEGKWKPK